MPRTLPNPPVMLSGEEENSPWISHAYCLKGWIPPVVLLGLAWLVFPYDVWISLHCFKINQGEPAFLRNILDNVEPFGHGVGVVIASLTILLLDKKQWKTGFSLCTAGVGAGILADIAKLWVSRIRPRNYEFGTLDVHDTIIGWMPLLHGGTRIQSFPSAHTATAFGMAVMLSTIYPRGRALFFLMAVLVMGHRLHSGAHYPSDILVGAAIGWCFALICVRLAVKYRYLKLENSPLQPDPANA